MKKNLLVFIYVLTFQLMATHLKAQTLFLDSALKKIYKIENDSIKKEQLLVYGEKQIHGNSKTDSRFYTELENKYKANGDDRFLGKIYSRFGFAYISIGDYSKAFPLEMKALNIFEKIKDPTKLIRACQDLMWIQLQLKDFESAKQYLEKGLALAKKEGLKAKEAELYNFYGIFYDSQKDFTKAINNYRQALVLNTQIGSKYNEISTRVNLGISLRRDKRFNESLLELQKAEELSVELKQAYYNQAIEQNLAELTFEMKNYPLAERYILKALAYQKSNEFVLKRGLFENLVKIYKQKEDYKKSSQYADSIILLNERVFERDRISNVRDLQAKYDVTLKEKRNAEQQILNLSQSKEIDKYKRIVFLNDQHKKLDDLSLSYQKNQIKIEKNYRNKIMLRNKLLAKKDSTIVAKKLLNAKLNVNNTKNLLMVIFSLFVIFIIFFISIYTSYKKNQHLNSIIISQKNELERINTDKDKIFSIVGHDLRSPFNTLKSFTYLIDNKIVTEKNIKTYNKELKSILSRTTTLLDNILNWSNSQMHGYNPKIKCHSLYEILSYEIDNLRDEYSKKCLVINNQVPENIYINSDANMLGVIFRNLISNAIKFSYPDGRITFSSDRNSHSVILHIKDEGVPINQEIINQFNSYKIELSSQSTMGTNNESGTGLGLFLIKNFVQILNAEVKISKDESKKGTKFSLKLPLNEENQELISGNNFTVDRVH